MSNLIAASVQRRVVGSATRKAVLLYMADKAADDGSGIWTSKANIARDLELSRRAVQIAIAELIRDGLVSEAGQRDCRHGYTVEYSILPEAVDKLVSTREQDSPRESHSRVTREPRSHDPVNQIHPGRRDCAEKQIPASLPSTGSSPTGSTRTNTCRRRR